ncbi:sensor histidine kinase/response regulator [Trichophyton equinum CBS 127.97]|uniref:histidine kinase n=1 Tax=Trichophyton equinum (strain ATCC MYA-4606 / CBS 127.97) TaxID=559882 RepID=F2PVY0_TRIEC|nr:sensor histidine kinase/response regulator [Trichophyton equinum CBS 127.97]
MTLAEASNSGMASTSTPNGKESSSSSYSAVDFERFTVSAQEKLAADLMYRQFETGQSNAIERLVALKADLRDTGDDAFWRDLMKELTSICNAQCGFVVEELASHGSTEDATGLSSSNSHLAPIVYYNNGSDEIIHRNYKPWAWDLPYHIMARDMHKSFLVADNLVSLVGESGMAHFPFPMAACLAVPLFDSRVPVARVGLMWTTVGLEKRNVSWAYLEMILHSLEDLILQRMEESATIRQLESRYSQENERQIERERERVREMERSRCRSQSSNRHPTPYRPGAGQPTLNLYARSMSHELRTPMHGVVGMLDMIHGTVADTIQRASDGDEHLTAAMVKTFESLRGDIEMVQDSARRAIEAADNIVHAYDLNMQVPDTLENSIADDTPCLSRQFSSHPSNELRPIFGAGIDVSINRKRPYGTDSSRGSSPARQPRSVKSPRRERSRTAEVRSVVEESDKIVHSTPARGDIQDAFMDAVAPPDNDADNPENHRGEQSDKASRPRKHTRSLSRVTRPVPIFPPMVLHYTKIRELLRLVINESLHVGGRPDSTITIPTDTGERIEIRSRSSNGTASTKQISLSVDDCVPETLYVDEKDLAKLVSCIFLNALKFTESGTINITAKLNHTSRYVIINVTDTGTGIPEAFLPNLFKAFAREDGSTTRSKEGLGLGLLVAKGLSRKLGGDLICVRSSTSGELQGSEFEIRLPIVPNDVLSRPSTPRTCASVNSTASTHTCTNTVSEVNGAKESQLDGHAREPEHPQDIAVPSTETHIPVSSRPTTPQLQTQTQAQARTFDVVQSPVHRPPLPVSLSTPIISTPMSTITPFDHQSPYLNGRQTLAERHPLTFMVAEDNLINRKILVTMLERLGYTDVYQAFDGRDAVRVVKEVLEGNSSQYAVEGSTPNASPKTISLPPPALPQHQDQSQPQPSSESQTQSQNQHQHQAQPQSQSQSTPPSQSPSPSPSPCQFSPSPSRSPSPAPSTESKFIDVILMDLWMPDMDGYEATERILSLVSSYRERMVKYDPANVPPLGPTVLAVSADVTDEALRRATKVGMEGYMTKPYKLRDLERLLVEFCARQSKWRI